MEQYILKFALVAEIERLQCPEHGYCLDKLLDFIDTLEVKEVQEEPVSEELEEIVDDYTSKVLERINCLIGNQPVGEEISKAVEFGAHWQKEQDIKHGYVTFLQGEKHFANYILEMINNGWHIMAIKTACNDKIKEV